MGHPIKKEMSIKRNTQWNQSDSGFPRTAKYFSPNPREGSNIFDSFDDLDWKSLHDSIDGGSILEAFDILLRGNRRSMFFLPLPTFQGASNPQQSSNPVEYASHSVQVRKPGILAGGVVTLELILWGDYDRKIQAPVSASLEFSADGSIIHCFMARGAADLDPGGYLKLKAYEVFGSGSGDCAADFEQGKIILNEFLETLKGSDRIGQIEDRRAHFLGLNEPARESFGLHLR